MLFRRLELENFKSHEKTTLDLENGITLITGHNGAGKSSIFEAITFALFSQSDVKNNLLVRTNKGLNQKLDMKVKLTFESGSTSYRVERTVSRTISQKKKAEDKPKENIKSNAVLYKFEDGRAVKIAESVREVNSAIEEILRMNASTFLSAIHVRQGQISQLVDDTPAKRKELIGQLLKLNDLEKAYKNITEVTKEFEFRQVELKAKVKPEGELEAELKKAKDEYSILRQKDEIFSKNQQELTDKQESKQKEQESLDNIKVEFDKQNNALAIEIKNLDNLNSYGMEVARKLEEISKNEEEMVTLKPYAERLERFTQFKDNHFKLKNLRIDEANKCEIISQNDANKQIIEKQKENYDSFNDLTKEIEEYENAKKEMSFEINQINQLENTRDDLTKDVTQYQKQLDSFYERSIGIISEFDTDDKLDELSLDDLESITSRLAKECECEIKCFDEKLNEYNSESIRLAHEKESVVEPLDDIRKVENKCPTCQSEISEAKKDELIRSYESTIETNTKRIAEIMTLTGEMSDKKALKEKSLKLITSVTNKIDQHRMILANCKKASEQLEEINEKISEIESKKLDLADLNKIIEEKRKVLNDLEPHYKEYVKAQTLLKSEDEEKQIKEHLNSLSNQINELVNGLNQIIELESDLSLDIEEPQLNSQIQDLNAKNTRYLQLMGSVKSKDEYEEKQKANSAEIDAKNGLIAQTKNTIESLGYDEQKHNDVKREAEELKKSVNELNLSIVGLQKDIEVKKSAIEDLENRIEENTKSMQKLDAVNEYITLLKDFRTFYSKDGVQKILRNQSGPIIQKYTRDFFKKFNFNYSDLTLSDEYDISLRNAEGEIGLDMVSGGEKIAIALSLRLAITQAMSEGSIDTILLDEPTIHLDTTRRADLINVLRSIAIIPQMIIVTHDDELRSAADRIITLKKFDDGISRIID